MQNQLSTLEKQAVCTFIDGDPNENPWVNGHAIPENIEVLPYDPQWPNAFAQEKNRLQNALGNVAIDIVHIGSTSVSGLAAKPVIDIDLLVDDPSQETDYVPQLSALGYELTIREPSWYEHRMLKHLAPRVNLHVFAPDCPEHRRHVLFKNWLLTHPDDLASYAAIKAQALTGTRYTHEYNHNKQALVREIYQKIFAQL